MAGTLVVIFMSRPRRLNFSDLLVELSPVNPLQRLLIAMKCGAFVRIEKAKMLTYSLGRRSEVAEQATSERTAPPIGTSDSDVRIRVYICDFTVYIFLSNSHFIDRRCSSGSHKRPHSVRKRSVHFEDQQLRTPLRFSIF